MSIIEKLLKLKHSRPTLKPNQLKIPVTAFKMNDEGMNEFNEIYRWLMKQNDLKTITRTKSGGISYERRNFKPPMWDVRCTKSCVELTIIIKEGLWRIQFRTLPQETKKGEQLTGFKAFQLFKKKCLEYGINLDTYAIDNGAEVKKEIEKPLIKLGRETFKNTIWENAHHIDFHNSYPAGLVNNWEEFRKPVEWMYENRKKDDGKWKLVLNATIGYMQSISCCNARWAHMSRAAIKDNNDRIRDLANRLVANGRVVLAYNTDGIWYTGEVYHGKGEGNSIGQWENDHTNCKLRFKSAGSYEYIENNIYTPVVRGFTQMDRQGRDRSKWKWGDIYLEECVPLTFSFNKEMGIISNHE